MKSVYMCRCGPYNYELSGMDLYDSFNALAAGSIKAKLRRDSRKVFDDSFPRRYRDCDLILSAEDERCVETAKLVGRPYKLLSDLREIGYKMEDFITKADFYDSRGRPRVGEARKLFVEALIDGRLSEGLGEAVGRIEAVMKTLREERFGKATVVTHSFFLKLVEVYLKDAAVKNDPSVIARHVKGKGEFYKFFGGFEVNL